MTSSATIDSKEFSAFFALRDEAVAARDFVQAALCDIAMSNGTTPARRAALRGAGIRNIRQAGARKMCLAAIAAARANG